MCCIYALHICGIYVGIYVDIYDDIYVTYMYVPYGVEVEPLFHSSSVSGPTTEPISHFQLENDSRLLIS